MLNQWNHRIPIDPPLPPPVAPPPSDSDWNFGFGVVQLASGIDHDYYDTSALFSYKLPAPWYGNLLNEYCIFVTMIVRFLKRVL